MKEGEIYKIILEDNHAMTFKVLSANPDKIILTSLRTKQELHIIKQ